MFAIAAKSFRDIRSGILWTGIAGALLAGAITFLFNSYASAMEGLADLSLYQGFTGTSTNITEPGGFLAAGFFSWMPLLLVIIGVLGGTGALSAQEEDGTLDLILAQPVQRWKVLLATVLGLGAAVSLAASLAIPAFVICIPLADLDLPVSRAVAAVIMTLPLVLVHLSIGLLFAALLPSRSAAVSATVAVAIAGYLAQLLGGITTDLEPIQRLSPFYWGEAGKVMADGFQWGRFLTLLGMVISLTILAAWRFQERDIAAGNTFRLPWTRKREDPPVAPPVEPSSRPSTSAPASRVRFPLAKQAALGMRSGAIGIGITAFLMAVMLGYYYPEVASELDDLGDLDWISDLTGAAGGYTTPAGFFSLEFFSWIPLLYLAIGVAAATGAVSTEETRGTIDAVLAQPLCRRQFITEKAAGITVALLASITLIIPGFALAIPFGDLGISLGTVCKALLMMTALVLMHSALALWLASWLSTRSAAVLLTTAVVTAGYVLQLVGSLVPALDEVRKLSPFYWSDAANAMVNGIGWGYLGVFTVLTGVFVWLAVISFERREIAAASGGAQPALRTFLSSLAPRHDSGRRPGPETGGVDVS